MSRARAGTPRLRRRDALGAAGLSAAALAAGCSSIERALGCAGSPAAPPAQKAATTDPAALIADRAGLLDLPAGFTYRVLQQAGDAMSDGYRVPGQPDAMSCFARSDGALVLMRNHELTATLSSLGPYRDEQRPPPEAYDPAAPGGVTRVVVDPKTLAVTSSNLVLTGTYWNCSGGVSPWGFLSCEETVDEGHGYVFLCPTDAERVAPARRIPGYGRFRHEAAAVHGRTLIAYLTEDEYDGALYRFVPSSPSDPFEGRLQALRVVGAPGADTGALAQGAKAAIDWVDVDDPSADRASTRAQAQARGAAIVRRGEGLFVAGDDVYVCATSGGPIERGQVLRLALGEPDTLHVLAAATDADVLDMPDAVCVAPNGVVYVAEDGYFGNYLRCIDARGRVTPFARNARSRGELAGICFAPDGNTMFVNMQSDQVTLAIRGPFEILQQHAAPTPDRHGGALGNAFAALALAVITRGQALGRRTPAL